jgi:hypothetical protein
MEVSYIAKNYTFQLHRQPVPLDTYIIHAWERQLGRQKDYN